MSMSGFPDRKAESVWAEAGVNVIGSQIPNAMSKDTFLTLLLLFMIGVFMMPFLYIIVNLFR